jgi:hypothetical protein
VPDGGTFPDFTKPLMEEQLARYVEEVSEWLGVKSCEIRKWFAKHFKK